MSGSDLQRKTVALVFGSLPTVEEIDQFQLVASDYDIRVIASESICAYLTQTSRFQDLRCIALPDHDDNTTYLPGLEQALEGMDAVIVKERLGMYAYQAVKAKWRYRFRLVVWVDNSCAFAGEDFDQLRTIRNEVTNAADSFIVQTNEAKTALQLEGVEASRIKSFPSYVEKTSRRDGKSRAEAAAALGLSDTDFIIAHIGQIEWEESLFELAHAVKLTSELDKTLGARIKLIFCGVGSFSTELRQRLVTLGLDRTAVYVAPGREAFSAVLTAADVMYYNPQSARDRCDAEPYRLAMAVANGVPVIAPRSAVVEELLGKHRLDFSSNSAVSLAKTLQRAASAASLRKDIVQKNQQSHQDRYGRSKVTKAMGSTLAAIFRQESSATGGALDGQVEEAESLVSSKQYLAAIDLIESLSQNLDMPIYHKANLHRLIGDCFTKLGDGTAGKDAYIKAAEFDPYSSKAYIGLGTVSLTRENYDIAVPQFQKAVSLAPNDEMANLGLGLAFHGMKEWTEAANWVKKALELNPENTAAIFTMVQIASAVGRYDEAIAVLENYLERHSTDHSMSYTLAALQYRSGKFTKARSLMEQVLAVDPYDDRAQALLIEIESAEQAIKVGTSIG